MLTRVTHLSIQGNMSKLSGSVTEFNMKCAAVNMNMEYSLASQA